MQTQPLLNSRSSRRRRNWRPATAARVLALAGAWVLAVACSGPSSSAPTTAAANPTTAAANPTTAAANPTTAAANPTTAAANPTTAAAAIAAAPTSAALTSTAPTSAAPAAATPATTALLPTAVAVTTQPTTSAGTQATSSAGTPTTASAGTLTTASAGTLTTASVGTPTAPTSQPAFAAQTAAAASASDDAVHLVLDSSASSASYHAHEQLVGRTLPNEAVGTTPAVSGTLVLGADGSVQADQSTITVDLTQLKSDESRRDNFIQGNTLETSSYPTATFVAREIQGLATPLPRSGEATFQLLGDLTVHGVTKPATWQVNAQFAGSAVTGDATTSVNLTDFGMTPPKAGPVLSIEDGLSLELTFTASRDA